MSTSHFVLFGHRPGLRRRASNQVAPLRGLGLAVLLALTSAVGCASAAQSLSTEPSDMASPTLAATPTPTPTPTPIPSPTGAFVATGDMTHARGAAMATLLADGRVLIAGGYDESGTAGFDDPSGQYVFVPITPYVASAELYDPSTGQFTPTGSMTTTRARALATPLADGRVLIAGGDGCLDPAKCTFEDWAGETALESAEIYDPATGEFTPTGSMSEPRRFGSAVLLADGRVLVLGPYSRLIEVYDPATGEFTQAGTLENVYTGVAAENYSGATVFYTGVRAVLLPNGKVLVVGNRLAANNTMAGPRAELFDPESGLSSSISASFPSSSVPGSARVQAAIVLQDGRALIHIFDLDSRVNHLMTYDSVTGTFTQAGSFQGPEGRFGPEGWLPGTVTLMRDGRVLFAGGTLEEVDSVYAGLAGLYDPATGFGVLSSKMIQGRTDQIAVALQDGTVLIAGGIHLAPTDSAELFKT